MVDSTASVQRQPRSIRAQPSIDYMHCLQVMLGVSPPSLFAEFWERGFQGHLLELSLDGSANFVVQAAFAAMTEAAQVTLRGHDPASQWPGFR